MYSKISDVHLTALKTALLGFQKQMIHKKEIQEKIQKLLEIVIFD